VGEGHHSPFIADIIQRVISLDARNSSATCIAGAAKRLSEQPNDDEPAQPVYMLALCNSEFLEADLQAGPSLP
jgi:hypothetical protein